MGVAADRGRELAELMGSARTPQGARLALATVRANRQTSLDLTYEGGDLDGVPCTTACTAARSGDRAVVMVCDHQPTALLVMASADSQWESSKTEFVTMTAEHVAGICT